MQLVKVQVETQILFNIKSFGFQNLLLGIHVQKLLAGIEQK
jgi:hypothetical protein